MDLKPTGVFEMCNESCSMGNDNDDKLLAKLKAQHEKKNIDFAMNLKNKFGFIIKHTAKDVEYTITGFREKNLGFLIFFFKKSSINFIKIHFKIKIFIFFILK